MSLHHVCEEELPPGPLPQLEARGHGGPLHVRHPAEQPRALHRPRGARALPLPRFQRAGVGLHTLCLQPIHDIIRCHVIPGQTLVQ